MVCAKSNTTGLQLTRTTRCLLLLSMLYKTFSSTMKEELILPEISFNIFSFYEQCLYTFIFSLLGSHILGYVPCYTSISGVGAPNLFSQQDWHWVFLCLDLPSPNRLSLCLVSEGLLPGSLWAEELNLFGYLTLVQRADWNSVLRRFI